MVSKDDIQQLRMENELLQIQMKDLNELISIREEELEILRNKAAKVVELKSILEGNLDQIVQMQSILGEEQRKMAGYERREVSMEKELLQSMSLEDQYYTLKEKYESSRASNEILESELADTTSLLHRLTDAELKIAELESSLEIAELENMKLHSKLNKLQQELDNSK